MSIKRNALGRGLDSLISMGEVQTSGSSAINEIPISQISPNPEQPRTNFDGDSLEELAMSIRELGIIQPLTLRSVGVDSYQIIWENAAIEQLAWLALIRCPPMCAPPTIAKSPRWRS